MPSSCKEIRQALAECLQSSDCVMLHRNSAVDCLRPPLLDTLPTRCQQLKRGYGECKRGMVDMRKRFRGNAPVALSKELEGGGGGGGGTVVKDGAGGQLYGGAAALGDVVGSGGGGGGDAAALEKK